MPDQYSIVIVDDHALFAQALKTLINTFDKYNVLYHVKNGEELKDSIVNNPVDDEDTHTLSRKMASYKIKKTA
jgi:hypothetical protein